MFQLANTDIWLILKVLQSQNRATFSHMKSYRPKFHVGLNPTVHFLCSGFRPRGHCLEVVGLNLEVEKLDSGFRPRGQYIAVVGLNLELEKL